MGIENKANQLLQKNRNLKSLGKRRIDKRICIVLIDKSNGEVISICPSKDLYNEDGTPEIRTNTQNIEDFLNENLEEVD